LSPLFVIVRIFLFLSLILPGWGYCLRKQADISVLDSLLRENQDLKERLNFLEARREAFRWARFPEGAVLRSGTVMQSLVTGEGRLALATDKQGLVFYDGTVFEVVNSRFSGLSDNFSTALALLPGNRAFIGTSTGLFYYDQGKVSRPANLPPELAFGPVSCLAARGEGELWVGTQGAGVWHLAKGRWKNYRFAKDSAGLSNDNINSLLIDERMKAVWAATAGGGVCNFDETGWRSYKEPLGPGSSEVYCLTLDADGLVWIGTVSAGAGYWDGVHWRKAPLPLGKNEGVVSISVLDGGDLFFGTTSGSFIYKRQSGAWQRIPIPEELSPYPIISASEAHGRLWLSPSGQGIYLYDRGIIERYGFQQGLPSDLVYDLAQAPDGRIWACTWNGAGIFDGLKWKRMGQREGLPGDLVTCVLFDRQGTVFFGTHNGVAVFSLNGWTFYNRDKGLKSNTINHLSLDSGNRLWISTEGGGLAVIDGDSLKLFSKAEGLPAEEVQATACDPDGVLWVATKKGLASLKEGKIIPASEMGKTEKTHPGPYHFTALYLAGDRSLWAATYGQGVWCRDTEGRWRQYTVEDGLGSNEVYAVAGGNGGQLFFGTAMGLSLFDRKHWRTYGPADGLNSGAVKSIAVARDSSLWLSFEGQGVIRFDLTRFQLPETYILTQSGLLIGQDAINHRVQLAAAKDTTGTGNSADTVGGRFLLENRYYVSLSGAARQDTIFSDRIELRCIGITPWWPEPATQFRYSYKLDSGSWSEFSHQSIIGLYGLKRGTHVISVRAKGPHLKIDPTAAIYAVFVDIPSILSDWRFYAVGLIILSLIGGIIFRREISWCTARIRHRHFRPVTPNPFNPNMPLRERERFFGREETLDILSESFSSGSASIIIHGGEKIGLTTLLLQTADHVRNHGAKTFYIDLARLYFPDINSLIEHLGALLADKDSKSSTGAERHYGTLEGFRDLVSHEKSSPVFFFDNAEFFGRLILRDQKLGPRLEYTLRELVLSDNGASFVFGLKTLDLFRDQVKILFDMSRIIRVGKVGYEAAKAIVTKPLTGQALLHDDALDLLVRLAGGQPFLLYALGQELVETMNRQQTTNLCTIELARRAVENLIDNPPILLIDRWEELTKREKLLLASAVRAMFSSSKPVSLSLTDIVGILSSHRISLLEEELAKASADLARRLLLSGEEGGRIIVEDSLLNRWIYAKQTIDRINALEEYDPGVAMRKLSEELSHSFRMTELADRVLSFLESILHFEWGALISGLAAFEPGTEVPLLELGKTGPEGDRIKLPQSLSGTIYEKLSLLGGSLMVEEKSPAGEFSDQTVPFPPGTLLVPLITRGIIMGFLALGRRRDGERYSRRDRLFVETIAEQVAISMENVRLYEEETEKERLRQELETARKMQMAILPERKPDFRGLDIFSYLNPATEIGGDYFDYNLIGEDSLVFIIGDVSGHGISAGTLVYMAKSCIFNQIRVDYSVEKMMSAMNDMVYGALKQRLLMTICYAVFDLKRHTLSYSIAGHPFPYHYSADSGKLNELDLSAYPLGVTSRARYKTAEISFAAGDIFVFYSDGIIEAMEPGGEQFGFPRFEKLIAANLSFDAETISRNIIKEFHNFIRENPQDDDVTLVVIKVK